MPPEVAVPPDDVKGAGLSRVSARQLRLLAVCSGLLAACFAKSLWALACFALQSEFYSYILLIPFTSVYLAWGERHWLAGESRPNRGLAALLFGAGLCSGLGYAFARQSGADLAGVDALAWTTLTFVILLLGACCFCLGKSAARALAFPLGLLIFLVPLPNALENVFVSFLQHRSAEVAELLFGIVGTPVLRQGVEFQLPGFQLEVAPECSGIRSTLVLFICSVVAAKLFLRPPLKRTVLVLAVVPLGILRNAVRIVTIGELCVHVSPDMINSPIHHKGGPLFFLVILVPFFGLLYALRRLDLRKQVQLNQQKKGAGE